MFEWLAGLDEHLGKFVYRGVHGEHPAWKLAIEGTVVPGDIDGLITAEEHNAGGVADRSPFTSWTHELRVAAFYAGLRGPLGVVLRVRVDPPPPGAGWSWEWSPDIFEESEVLLRGIRKGVEVFGHGDVETGTRRSIGER